MTPFHELGLSDRLVSALATLCYEKPTPIQQITIPQILMSEQDLKAFAQTGTGKTAAFSLPVIEKIDLDAIFRMDEIGPSQIGSGNCPGPGRTGFLPYGRS